jgi:glutamate dehydrogenase
MVWYVRNVDFSIGLNAVISRYRSGIREIAAALGDNLPEDMRAGRGKRRQ